MSAKNLPEQNQSFFESAHSSLFQAEGQNDLLDNMRSDQHLTSLQPRIVEVSEKIAEANDFVKSNVTPAFAAEKATAYDNFCTPANKKFYAAKPYTKLNQALKEFRLLRVFPRRPCWQHYESRPSWDVHHANGLDRSQPLIACEIEKTSLSRIGDNYVTLSYCAGDPKKTAIILVDGLLFNAFANLEHAMDRLLDHWSSVHHEGEPLLLWADQISINQSDKDERSEQVQIMRDIYRRSAEMYVCMSVPKLEDCLSWVPTPTWNKSTNVVSRKGDPYAITKLKDLLLDFLVGKEKGGELRSFASRSTKMTETIMDDKNSNGQILVSPNGSLVALQPRFSFDLSLRSHGSLTTLKSPRHVRDLSRNGFSSFNSQKSLQVSATEFQSSLAAFMANKWWQR